jgi:phage gp29-like protein
MTDEIKKPLPDTDEVATRAKDVTYSAYAGILRVLDETLLTRGQSKGLKIYDEIERDCTVYGDMQKRKLAVVSRPWQVDSASDNPLDVQAANLVRAQLSSEALNFDNVCLNLLDAILKGYAVGEVMWGYDGSQIVVTQIKARNQIRFWFDDQEQLRMKTLANLIPGEQLPERKFIVHSFGSKDGSPFGLGIGTRLFWPAFFKRKGIAFWLTFLDKFATPTPVGTYPNGTSTVEQANLLGALDAMSQSAGIVIPQGMVVQLLETQRSGASDAYERLSLYMDTQITHTILGESPIAKGGGGQAASAAITRNEVRLELVQADADLLSATLNSTLIKWITEFNVPGAKPPRVWRKVEEQKDLGAVATRDLTICEMGFKPSLDYINATYGGNWEVAPPPAASKPAADNAGGPGGLRESNFAEATATDTAALTAQLESQIADAWAAVMSHVNELVAQADSMEALQTSLVKAYGSLPLADLRKIMAQGFQVAALAGVKDVAASVPSKTTTAD